MTGKHYSNDDKLKLIALVKLYVKVVENKKTDAVGNFEKDRAWCDITKSFNKKVKFSRTVESLRTCWQHIKRDAKKNSAQLTQQTRATGGGVNTARLDAVDTQALEIIHQFSVKGLQNIFDSDAENECPNKVVFDHMLQTEEINQWNKWDPQKLKTSLSTPLRNAITNASQPIPSTSTGVTNASRQNSSAAQLLSLKVEAFGLLKKSLTENHALENEYLKTKLEREKLELEILKANYSGLRKRKNNDSSHDKIKQKIFSYDAVLKNNSDNDKVQKTASEDDNILKTRSVNDDRIFISSDSD